MKPITEMKFHIGQKIRIYPSYTQKRIIAKSDGAERYIYNKLVALNEEKQSIKSSADYSPSIRDRLNYINTVLSSRKELINTIPFLNDNEIDAYTIDNAIINYRRAWENCKANPSAKKPTFHKKGYRKAYHTNAHYHSDAEHVSDCNVRLVDKNHILLPKLGRIRFSGSEMFTAILVRTEPTRIGKITVSMDTCGRYYASFSIGSDAPFYEKLPETGEAAGYDLGIRKLYTDSDGNNTTLPDYYKKSKEKLAKEQRKLSRRGRVAKATGKKLSESKNYQKQRIKVAAIHTHTAAQRRDFLNNLSKREVKNHDKLFVEDVSSKELLMDYANMGYGYGHNFARVLSDKSWGIFTTMLAYKADLYGRTFRKVKSEYTTDTCSTCGFLTDNGYITIGMTEWVCPACGVTHDRDKNAAINILRRGLSSP